MITKAMSNITWKLAERYFKAQESYGPFSKKANIARIPWYISWKIIEFLGIQA